ncbi:zinc finger protein 107-like [Symsagittifera roscoffensis]|uniref:zinc finger protein 107-like n=1 Tax=Symsagittifera roscoffensis TaxID=84072 RepID=UPI00307B8666
MASKFCCRICTEKPNLQIFSNWYSLESHIYQLHFGNVFPFQCDECRAVFQAEYNLRRHRERSHLRIGNNCPDECLVIKNCPVDNCQHQQILAYEELRNHLQSDHSDLFKLDKYTRQNLRKVTFSKVSTPKMKKLDNSNSKFSCPYKRCGAWYSSKKLFNKHLRDHDLFLSLKCPRCQKRLEGVQAESEPSLSEKTSHCDCYKTHPYTCPEENCLKVFPSRFNLKTHFQLVHSGATKYQCDFCDDVFKSQRSLCEHIQVHFHPRSFHCNLCGEFFNQKTALVRHVTTLHEGRRAHFCCVCGRSFSQSGNLVTHLNNVHKLKCEKCFGQFQADNKQQLEDHVTSCNGHIIYLMDNDNCDLEQEVTVIGS